VTGNHQCDLEVPQSLTIARDVLDAWLAGTHLIAYGENAEARITAKLLDHFVKPNETLWMGSAKCQKLFQQHGPRLALKSPFLLHAILSISAHHLDTLFPGGLEYRQVGASHYSSSLSLYVMALQDLENVNVDAIFACCLLLSLIAFRNIASGASDSVSGTNEKRLVDIAALKSIRGFQILQSIPSLRLKFATSIWRPIMDECFDHRQHLLESPFNSVKGFGIMTALESLCRDQGEPASHITALEPALDMLRMLMKDESDQTQTIGVLFCFTKTLDGQFLTLLEQQDPKAALLVCYWYSLMAQIDQWWALDSAKTEAWKLLGFLQRVPDPRLQALLQFPLEQLEIAIKKQ
jgi:hypothetical protein